MFRRTVVVVAGALLAVPLASVANAEESAGSDSARDQTLSSGDVVISATDEQGSVVPAKATVRTDEVILEGEAAYRAVIEIEAGPVRQKDGLLAELHQYANAATSLADADAVCRTDGSLSVKACVTIYYNVKNSSDFFLSM